MSRKPMTDTELAARLDNIENTLKEIAVRLAGSPAEVTPGSAAVKMIARELANNPDQYSHKRRMVANN